VSLSHPIDVKRDALTPSSIVRQRSHSCVCSFALSRRALGRVSTSAHAALGDRRFLAGSATIPLFLFGSSLPLHFGAGVGGYVSLLLNSSQDTDSIEFRLWFLSSCNPPESRSLGQLQSDALRDAGPPVRARRRTRTGPPRKGARYGRSKTAALGRPERTRI
jgi:hypothetical protein